MADDAAASAAAGRAGAAVAPASAGPADTAAAPASAGPADRAGAPASAGPADTAGLIAGLATVTAWGSAFVGIRAAGQALSPGALALGRLVVSCAVLGAVALVRHEPLPRRRDLV